MEQTENPVSQRIVQAAATITDVDPLELPPLFEAVDPDALDALVSSSAASGTGPLVEFRYEGYVVTVAQGGEVALSKPGD